MNKRQRKFLFWALLATVLIVHLVFCEWSISGCVYHPYSYGGAWRDWGCRGIIGFEWLYIDADTTLGGDHKRLVATLLGLVLPGVIIGGAVMLKLGQTSDKPQAEQPSNGNHPPTSSAATGTDGGETD